MERKVTFGKYKGLTVSELIRKQRKYALWAHKNVSFFSLPPDELEACLPRGGPDDRSWEELDDYERQSEMDDASNWSDFGNN